MSKKGVNVDWDGRKFVPKSLNIFRDHDIREAWGQLATVTIRVPKQQEATYRINLTPAARREVVDRVVDLQVELRALRTELEARLQQVEATTDTRLETLEQRTQQQVSQIMEDSREAKEAAGRAHRTARRASRDAERARRSASTASRVVGSVRSVTYRLRGDADVALEYYCTGSSSRQFPSAFASNVRQFGEDCTRWNHSWSVNLVRRNNEWCITAHNLLCERLDLTVHYFGKRLMGAAGSWTHDLKDHTRMRLMQ